MRYLIVISALMILAAAAPAADDWAVFHGQVDGPVAAPPADPLAAFRHRELKGMFWAEGYYHHMNFPDGYMVTVSAGFDMTGSTLIFVVARSGMEPFHEYKTYSNDQVSFDRNGFGMTIGPNRMWLKGDKYFMHIDTDRVKADIRYDILAPPYTYGDGMEKNSNGKVYSIYTLPIPWAKVKVDAVCGGKTYHLQGFGNMNHDDQVRSPLYYQTQWRVFWFFADDHALALTDFNEPKDFSNKLVQRLVFAEKGGRMFTSTNYSLTWDDWVDVPEHKFRYPRHYMLRASAGGAELTADIRQSELLLDQDLYSNLPPELAIAKHFFKNGWTYDMWCDYTLTYRHDGSTASYSGRGVGRWMGLEEE